MYIASQKNEDLSTEMKVEHVENCIFSRWYSSFSSSTVKSVIIPLSDDVVKYLLADGIVLPAGSNHGCNASSKNSDSDDNSDVNWDDNACGKNASMPKFSAEFDNEVQKAIKKLGGRVFCKLNWSSPRDASWVATGNTLECECIGDILLLLKSSDFVTHDLTAPFENCDDVTPAHAVNYELVLRKWTDITPSAEFRCFVKDHKIVSISQRHYMVHYPFTIQEKRAVMKDIVRFHNSKIAGRFADSNYVIDIYRNNSGRVVLLDFNPFGVMTDSLLFSWKELLELDNKDSQDPEIRCLETEYGVQPNEYQAYGVPQDFVDLSRGEDPFKFVDFMKLRDGSFIASSSSDEDEIVS